MTDPHSPVNRPEDEPTEQTAPVAMPSPTPAEPEPDAAAGTPEPDAAPAPTPRRRWLRRRPPAGTATPEQAADGAPAPEATTPPAADGEAADGEAADGESAAGAEPAPPAAAGTRRLRRDRRRLISRREEAVYHLGGLAFELYRRDMLNEDVMRRRAGEVAEIDDSVRDIDARLGEIDRERRARRRGEPAESSAGCCLTCRTPFRAEARFCWQCGAQLVPPSVGDEQVTAVITTGPAAP